MSRDAQPGHHFFQESRKAALTVLYKATGFLAGIRFRLSYDASDRPRDALFTRALDFSSEKQKAFVAGACGRNAALRDDVTSLLEAHDAAQAFFDQLAENVISPTLSALNRPLREASQSELARVLDAGLDARYQIVRELAGGGMSRVFLADDLRLRRSIVIKVLPHELARATDAEHFRHEIELAARLQHPHIVPLLDSGSVNGTLYYTMPFIEGESLRDLLSRSGSVPAADAVRIWQQVLDALAYAHASGVMHLDIKPGNILLSARHALVTDFGISRAIETMVRQPRSSPPEPVIGTPAYMAPEASAGFRELDHRVDLYSAGLVMYEMLAGAGPFAADSANEFFRAHRNDPPPAPSAPNVPRQLITLVMQCLAKDPDDRPQSAEEVLAKLKLVAALVADSGKRTLLRRKIIGTMAIVGVLAVTATVTTTIFRRPVVSSQQSEAGERPATEMIAAYEWYRRGMDVALLRTDEGRRQGVAYFSQAISIDSNFVDAWAGLVRMYVQLSNAAAGSDKRYWLLLARESALKAVDLDTADASAHAALGWVYLLSGGYEPAESEFILAIQLDSSVPRGHEGLARVYMMTGRPRQQMVEAELGVNADPYSHSAVREMALALTMNGRCEESLDQLLPLKSLSPPAGVAGILRGQCLASNSLWPEAIDEFRWASENSAVAGLAFLGYALAKSGRTDEAVGILADLTSGRKYSHGSWGIAVVNAGLENYDSAFNWLEAAIDDGSMSFYVLLPLFDDLHRDSRFVRIAERMKEGGWI